VSQAAEQMHSPSSVLTSGTRRRVPGQPTEPPPLLIAENVSKRFGPLTVLDSVSLRLEPGSVHALLGENGAGKSTLVKCIMGFYHADGGRVVVKSEGSDKWSVVESSLPIPKLDHSIPTGIVSALASLVTNEFADGAKSGEAGLDAPATTVTVSLKGGKSTTVLIGNKKGEDDYYLKTAEAPQVFVVKRYNIDRVDKRPIDFRDKALCDIAEADLGDLNVTHDKDSYSLVRDGKSNEWKATKPAALTVDPSKVGPIAGAFKDFKAAGFAEDQNAKASGLAKPKAVIVAHSKDKKASCILRLGDETKDKVNYVAMAGASPDVYLVAKWAADRVLVKVDDLKKK